MKRIPPIPPEGPSKFNDVANRVAKRNPRMYKGKYDPVELEEWIEEWKTFLRWSKSGSS